MDSPIRFSPSRFCKRLKALGRVGLWAACVGIWILDAALAQAGERQVLKVHVPAAARAKPVGRLAGTQHLEVVLALPLRQREALTNLLQQLYDPSSTNYHRYLSPGQFAARFSPTEEDYEKLRVFARANGLTVGERPPNRTLLRASGTVASLEKIFHVTLRLYHHPTEPRQFYAPEGDLAVEAPLPLLTVSGLDNQVLPRPMSLRGSLVDRARSQATSPSDTSSEALSFATGSGPRGNFIGRDFRAAYAPGVTLDGTGQAVGLFELDGYYRSDILTYESLAGLPNVPLVNVLLSGAPSSPGPNNLEVALDIEMAIAMAPGLAQVIVYEGNTPNEIFNRMATDNLAKQLSCSWGFGPQTDPARDQIFQQFAAQGQSLFQASGDIGAYAGAVYPPSDNPFLTVVGGTSLTTSNGAWSAETVWPLSGGGVSTTYSIPVWQQGVDMSSNQGSNLKRNLPDVACLADSVIWVVVNNGEQGSVGGTSAAAPLWAGFAALANQQAATAGQPSLGFLNPALYAIGNGPGAATAFHDVLSGANTNASSTNKFFAVPGYDLCTGWGTPTGSNTISALLAPPPALRIWPTTPITFTGPVGGPFSPASAAYCLTNGSTSTLSWGATNPASWLKLSPTNGTLNAASPGITVTVAPDTTAWGLPAGTYTARLDFTNSSDPFSQSRQVVLEVYAPPVLTTQPTNQAVFEGMTASFSVGVATNGGLSCQWHHDNGMVVTNVTDDDNVLGATTRTLTIANVSAADVGAYSVVVSNAAGVVSSANAFLTIIPWRPVFTLQPTNQTVLPGQDVELVVEAAGASPLVYCWQKDGTNVLEGGNVSGTATPRLRLSNLAPGDAGAYSVVVSNALASVRSDAAVVTVTPVTAPGAGLVRLCSFGGSCGANPNGLLQATNGLLYGTTENGGSNALGTLFQLATNGPLTALYSFSGGDEGANPHAPLLQGPDGNLYGTAFQGGAYDNGTVFRSTLSGSVSPLVSLDMTNGDLLLAGLALGADGSFYGTAHQGGTFGRGTVFRVTTNGALGALYSFANGADGELPYGGLVQGKDLAFYGTTYRAGAFDLGTVFQVTAEGDFKTLHAFDGANGSLPYSTLVQGSDGQFYGTTAQGGSAGAGTVFRLRATGEFTNLYSFTGGADGSYPMAGLLEATDGNFYGTTTYGGVYGNGTLFRLAPDSTLTTLAQFDGYNGANPQAALVQGADGALYGSTWAGGPENAGVVFRLSFSGAPQITSQPSGQTVFAGADVQLGVAVSGSLPFTYQWRLNGTNLTENGPLAGATNRLLMLANVSADRIGSYSVVVSNVLGAITSAPAWLQVTSSPPYLVVQPTNQTLVPGVTATFAASALGNLPLSYCWQLEGTNLSDGAGISGSRGNLLTLTQVTEANNGNYWLVVSNALGSATSSVAALTVIPVSAPGTRLTTLHAFSGSNDGRRPNGLVLATNGLLYGTTAYGGAQGTVFCLSTNGQMTTLALLGGTNGSIPKAGLANGPDGALYGTAQFGGQCSGGTVFRIEANGALSPLHSFTGDPEGANPVAPLVMGSDTNFYGTTQNGGTADWGTLFRLAPDGTLTTLYSFTNGPDGSSPTAGLLQAADGNFYGTTQTGGTTAHGNVFRWSPDGTLANLYSFAGAEDGYNPVGTLLQGTDGALYGVTRNNTIRGYQFYGTIFKITLSGVLTTLYPLNYTDGSYPYAGLVEASDGNFYGTTHEGGNSSNGTLFRLSPSGSYSVLVNFDGFNDGAHPEAALVEGADGCLYGTTSTGGPGGQGTVFRLGFTAAPQITTPPAKQGALLGSNVLFSVAVTGSRPLCYQWLKNGTNLTEGVDVLGSTNRVLQLNNLTASSTGTYSVVVSNQLGSVTSPGALLTVVPMPVLQAQLQANQTVRLTWSTASGQRYLVQYKSSPGATTWTNLGSYITATGPTLSVSDSVSANAQRFYRVVFTPR